MENKKKAWVQRRTFAALAFEKGSRERAEYNAFVLTSEYYPSHKYVLFHRRDVNAHPAHLTFRTKREAEDHMETMGL